MDSNPERRFGKHYVSGEFDPKSGKHLHSLTFSLGVFEWVPKVRGGGKKGPVKVRVYGPSSFPNTVWREALRVAEALDAGVYTGPHRLTVKIR